MARTLETKPDLHLPALLHSPPVVTVAQMRRLEAAAAQAGIPESELQRRAARALADLAQALAPPPAEGLCVVLVGPGNNGRDAMLAGSHLLRRRYRVSLYLGPRHAVDAAELAALVTDGANVAVQAESGDRALERLRAWLPGATFVLDGLLGIGARGALRPPLDEVAALLNEIRRAERRRPLVLAVDVPSGIDADSGQVLGACVQADVTAALGAIKAGTLRFPAAECVGRLLCLSIGLPPDSVGAQHQRVLDEASVASLVPRRPLSAHKGSLGKVLVVGGSRQYLGAPLLSALAAARSGCGLVALAGSTALQQAAATVVPEATFVGPLDFDRESAQSQASLAERWTEFDAVVLGPGLGRSPGAQALVRELLGFSGTPHPPIVVDADALYALALWERWWQHARPKLVLTPHHGEMSRLTGQPLEQVAQRNWEAAAEAATTWGQVVVLKGPHTSVAEPDGGAEIHARPTPALATAGSGDVLAGLIAGLLAQGLERWAAARLGVVAHATAARLALERGSRRSLVASDVASEVPMALGALERQGSEPESASPRFAAW